MRPKPPSLRLLTKPALLSALALMLLSVVPAAAQHGTGIVSVRALDREGAVLPGARVKLEPGDITGASKGQGEFTLIGITAGDYRLTISYVGFVDFTQQIKILAGQAGARRSANESLGEG
jgi:Carboxypeptidase regulatory-like domain